MKTEKDSQSQGSDITMTTCHPHITDSTPVSDLEPSPFYPFSAEDFCVDKVEAADPEKKKEEIKQKTSPLLAMHNYAESPEKCHNTSRSPNTVVNQGFKHIYEDEPPPKPAKAKGFSGNGKGSTGQRKSNYFGGGGKDVDNELEDEIIQNCVAALDDSKWSQRYCPHCLSIEEIESLLKTEADKFSELQQNLNDDDGGGGEWGQILKGRKDQDVVNDENSFPVSSEYDRLWLQNNKNFAATKDQQIRTN